MKSCTFELYIAVRKLKKCSRWLSQALTSSKYMWILYGTWESLNLTFFTICLLHWNCHLSCWNILVEVGLSRRRKHEQILWNIWMLIYREWVCINSVYMKGFVCSPEPNSKLWDVSLAVLRNCAGLSASFLHTHEFPIYRSFVKHYIQKVGVTLAFYLDAFWDLFH